MREGLDGERGKRKFAFFVFAVGEKGRSDSEAPQEALPALLFPFSLAEARGDVEIQFDVERDKERERKQGRARAPKVSRKPVRDSLRRAESGAHQGVDSLLLFSGATSDAHVLSDALILRRRARTHRRTLSRGRRSGAKCRSVSERLKERDRNSPTLFFPFLRRKKGESFFSLAFSRPLSPLCRFSPLALALFSLIDSGPAVLYIRHTLARHPPPPPFL